MCAQCGEENDISLHLIVDAETLATEVTSQNKSSSAVKTDFKSEMKTEISCGVRWEFSFLSLTAATAMARRLERHSENLLPSTRKVQLNILVYQWRARC